MIKQLRRVVAFTLVFALVFGLCPVLPTVYAVTPRVIYEEGFESGDYSVVDGLNGTNHTKSIMKNGAVQWTMEKSGGAAFTTSDAFEYAFNTDLIGEFDNNVSTINDTLHFNTYPGRLADESTRKTANVKMWRNLVGSEAEKYTEGKVVVDIRMMKPDGASSTSAAGTSLYLYESPITGYSSAPKKVCQIRLANASTPRIRYPYEWQGETTAPSGIDSNTASNSSGSWTLKGWVYLRIVADIDTQTVDIQFSSTTPDKLIPYTPTKSTYNFYGNGSKAPYTRATGISAIGFEGTGGLAFDDVKITHISNYNLPMAKDVAISGNPIEGKVLTGTYGSYYHESLISEGDSFCTWYRADDSDFLQNLEVIKTEPLTAGHTSNYTLTAADIDKYVKFAVTPKSVESDHNTGFEAFAALENSIRPFYATPHTLLLSPTAGQLFSATRPVQFYASSFCDVADIDKVEFYAGDRLLATDYEEPYEAEALLTDGSCDVYAIGYDTLGRTGTSPYVSIIISSVEQLSIYGSDGVTPLSNTVNAYGPIYASASLKNTQSESINASIFISIYNAEGKILAVKNSISSIPNNGEQKTMSVSLEVDNNLRLNAHKIKAFLWNSDNYQSLSIPAVVERGPIRIMTIGNSFANNAATYLQTFASRDRESLIVGKANLANASYATHASNYRKNSVSYEFPVTGMSGLPRMTLKEALTLIPWDFITVQQASYLSNDYSSFDPELGNLVKYITQNAPQAKILLHQTWAYAEKCPRLINPSASYYLGITQMEMYNGIVHAYGESSKKYDLRVLPVGVAFQAFRAVRPDSNTTSTGGTLNVGDGYHCNELGKYLAGAVWYEAISGRSTVGNTYRPSGISAESTALAQNLAHEAVLEYNWLAE